MLSRIEICYTCLRTDRNLKVLDQELSSFHYKLCDFSIENLVLYPQYCYECEYLLKKMYKFKNKCWNALDILQSWIKADTADKCPLTTLWTHIPASLAYPQGTESIMEHVVCTGETESNTVQITSGNPEESNKIKFEITEDTDKVNLNDLLLIKSEDTGFQEILIENDAQINHDKINDHIMTEDEASLQIDSESNDSDTLFTILQNDKRTKIKETDRKLTRKRCYDKVDKSSDKSTVKNKPNKEKDKSGSQKETKDCQKLKSKEDGNKRSRFHTKTKGLLSEMTNGFDTKVANRKVLKKPYSKERLISELESRFSKCGSLVSSDGVSIDKEFVLKCLHDRANEYVMKQLYNTVHRKTTSNHFKPLALKLFKSIQTKYSNSYESVFDVEYLNTTQKVYEEFARRKSYECYVQSAYKCDVCYQGFKHEKMLTNHLKCHDKSAGDMECPICKMRFKSRKVLIGHQSSHEAVYKCKLCPLITYHRCSMVNHYHLHKGMKYKCEQCNATFGSVSAQRTHMSYRHARAHACAVCGRAYSTRMGLRAHHTRYHANESPDIDKSTGVRCSQCSLTLASWEAYCTHQRYTHGDTHGDTPRGRPPGSKSTTGTRRPSAVPRKRPVMTCRVCNAVGDSVGWLQLHFSEQHPAVDRCTLYADKHTHLCHICGKSFATQYYLQEHQNIHTGVRPYSCEVCSARFHRSVSLRLHASVHQPASKPCTRCGKKFRTASNLNSHMRSHIGNRRFKCNICGKGFIHRNSVNEHVRGVHKNIRRVRKRGAQGVQIADGRENAAGLVAKDVLEQN